MPTPRDRDDIELSAIVSAQGFLLELLLKLICEFNSDPQARFLEIGGALLEIIRTRVADPFPRDARAVLIGEEVEQVLKTFLAGVCVRMGIPLSSLFPPDEL